MALNEPRIRPFTGGHRRAVLSDSVKCGPFRCNAWYHPPLGKNWGVCLGLKGGEGGDRGWVGGGFSIGAKVTSGKREKEDEKKNSQDPLLEVQHSCHKTSGCSQQKNERKKRGEICISLCS